MKVKRINRSKLISLPNLIRIRDNKYQSADYSKTYNKEEIDGEIMYKKSKRNELLKICKNNVRLFSKDTFSLIMKDLGRYK